MKQILSVLLVALLFGCSDKEDVKIPDTVLAKERMAEVMIDIHLLEASANLNIESTLNTGVNVPLQTMNVFRTHGTTKKQYEESFTFYTRNPKLLVEVYQQVLNGLSKMQAEVTNEKNKD